MGVSRFTVKKEKRAPVHLRPSIIHEGAKMDSIYRTAVVDYTSLPRRRFNTMIIRQ